MSGAMRSIEVADIDECPWNPRTVFEDIDELAADIAQRGLLVPIVVRQMDQRWELVCGHRRLMAMKKNGALYVPAIIRDLTDAEVAFTQLAESAHGHPLLPLDEARAMRRLMQDFKYTRERIASGVGKSAWWVSNRLSLLNLAPEALKIIEEAKLSTTHATYIGKKHTPAEQVEMAARIAANPVPVVQARQEAGQLSFASPHVRGQVAMRDRIRDLLLRGAKDMEAAGEKQVAAVMRSNADTIAALEPWHGNRKASAA